MVHYANIAARPGVVPVIITHTPNRDNQLHTGDHDNQYHDLLQRARRRTIATIIADTVPFSTARSTFFSQTFLLHVLKILQLNHVFLLRRGERVPCPQTLLLLRGCEFQGPPVPMKSLGRIAAHQSMVQRPLTMHGRNLMGGLPHEDRGTMKIQPGRRSGGGKKRRPTGESP